MPGSLECRADARLRPVLGSAPAAPDRAGTSSTPVPRAGPPAMPPGPAPRSAQSSSRPHPEHPHWRGPARRHGAGCPPCRSCRRAHRNGRRAPPSPYSRASSEGSGSSQVLQGSSPITFTSPSSKAHQKSGSFAPPALPGLVMSETCSACTLQRPCPTPAVATACRDVEAATLANDGSPPITTNHLSDVPCPLPRRIERVRVSIASPLMQPSPNGRRVGIRIVTIEACSGFTRVTARRIAQPPKATFVARLQPSQLPSQAARQLPEPIDNYPGEILPH
jgi:hypothetical protein